jgi:hypothetical protein
MRTKLPALALAAVAAVGCNSPSGPDPIPAGGYAYTAFDAAGAVVVKGWLTLDLQDPSQVTGAWHLQSTRNDPGPGAETGDGQLAGRIDGDTLIVDLNPGFADNNTVLVGRLDGAKYRGQWTWSGFAGPANGGTFDAVRP